MKEKIVANTKIHNKFIITKRDVRTDDPPEIVGYAYNIILDQMWDRVCNEDTYFNSIAFGRGNGTLDPTRTTLFDLIDVYCENDRNMGNDVIFSGLETVERSYYDPYAHWIRKITIAPDEHQGETITEVGINYNTYAKSGNEMVTHALVEDAEGAQISIAKGNYDLIELFAVVYVDQSEEMYGGQVTWYRGANAVARYLLGEETLMLTEGVASTFAPTYQLSGEAVSLTKVRDPALAKIDIVKHQFNTAQGNYPGGLGLFTYGTDLDYHSRGHTVMNPALVMRFPITGVYEPALITGEVLGAGDGATTRFQTEFKDFDPASFVLYVDGSPVAGTDYTLNPRKDRIDYRGLLKSPTFYSAGWNSVSTNHAAIYEDFIIISQRVETVFFDYVEDEIWPRRTLDLRTLWSYIDPNKQFIVLVNDNTFRTHDYDTLELLYTFDETSTADQYWAITNEILATRDWETMRFYSIDPGTGEVTALLKSENWSTEHGTGTPQDIIFLDNHVIIAGTNLYIFEWDSATQTVGLEVHQDSTTFPSTVLRLASLGDNLYAVRGSGEEIQLYEFVQDTEVVTLHGNLITESVGWPEGWSFSSWSNASNGGDFINRTPDGNLICLVRLERPDETFVSTIMAWKFDAATKELEYIVTLEPEGVVGTGALVLEWHTDFLNGLYLATGRGGGDSTGDVIATDFGHGDPSWCVEFNTAPSAGTVTCDYEPLRMPKNENHVAEIEFTLQFADGNV